ncbi:MAG: ATP-binding protein [Desulfovibrionaceae bacterium]
MSADTYRKLRWKLMAITLGFSLVPLFALGHFIQDQFSKSYREKLTGNLRLVLVNKRDALDMFLAERVAQLKNLANTHSFDEMRDQRYLTELFDIIHETSSSFIDLGVINQQGRHEAYSGPYDLSGIDYRNEDWFAQVMLRGVYVSDVFLGFRNFPHFIIAVKRREGEKTWILRATIDSEVFTSLVRNVRSGSQGDAFLVNQAWELQTPSRFSGGVLSRADLPEYLENAAREVLVAEWERDGEIMVTGVTPLKLTGWRLVVTENAREELSPLFQVRYKVLSLFAMCGLMIGGATWVTVNSVVSRLREADRERAALDATFIQSSKMASLGKMAAGVAHEINNPLSIIRESAGWIRDMINDGELEGYPGMEDLQEAVNDIDRHVERARTVTHRMLGFASRMEPFQENVDLNHIARETVAFLESEVRHRNIGIVYELDPGLPLVTTDANQVQQILLNLVENAIDAVDDGGTVTVASRPEGDHVAMEVRDTGTGIPPEQLSRIFDPFFTTKAPGEGTGLGLSIIYTTIKKLGGTIAVASEPGKGSTFTFTLPCAGAMNAGGRMHG